MSRSLSPLHQHQSQTQVVAETDNVTQTELVVQNRLRLVGAQSQRPHVQWTEDTIDNEHLNRKKSKICCIYHPTREFGESSDESDISEPSSSSSSESDSDTESESGCCGHGHGHRHGHRHRPNAYERQPMIKR